MTHKALAGGVETVSKEAEDIQLIQGELELAKINTRTHFQLTPLILERGGEQRQEDP